MLDLSSCTKLFSGNVKCDDNLKPNIIWASTTTSTEKGQAKNPGLEIIATLPEFQATHTGEYIFDVSLNKTVPEGSTLFLIENSGSEDLQGIFTIERVKVSAYFEDGKTYSPVIVAADTKNQFQNNGGCNISNLSIFITVGLFFLKQRKNS